jgi:hypothetical protein
MCKACITGINDTGEVLDHYSPVLMILLRHDLINNTGNSSVAGVIDTGEVHSDTELI